MSAQRLLSWAAFIVAIFSLGAGQALGQPLELGVKRPHLFGGSRGTLVFGDRGIEYRTNDRKDARTWSYDDVKQVQVVSPTRITVRTYEDRGWTRMWSDRSFEFQVTKGTVTPALVTFLLATIPRPVMTAVLPAAAAAPRFRVAAKHVKRHGSNGELLLYNDALVFQSPEPGASRYWRFGDLASVLSLDRYRVEVVAHEGGAGDTRPFLFQLKNDLPPGFYDALWSSLNAPPPLRSNGGDEMACCSATKPAKAPAGAGKGGR